MNTWKLRTQRRWCSKLFPSDFGRQSTQRPYWNVRPSSGSGWVWLWKVDTLSIAELRRSPMRIDAAAIVFANDSRFRGRRRTSSTPVRRLPAANLHTTEPSPLGLHGSRSKNRIRIFACIRIFAYSVATTKRVKVSDKQQAGSSVSSEISASS